MDNSEWRKWQKESWPVGSLHRALVRDFPGCKSLSDALNKTILKNSPSSEETRQKGTINEALVKTKEPTEFEKYCALRENIKSIEHYIHNGFDTWQVPEHIRKRLDEMSLNSPLEARLWADCWKAEIRKIKELSGGTSGGNSNC